MTHGLQRTRLPYPPLSPRGDSDLLKFISIESVMPSTHLTLCRLLLLLPSSPPAFIHSQHHGLFQWASQSSQFSHSVVSDSLRPHESQHTRPPCPSPTPRVHSDSCPLSWWCHPASSSSVVLFSSCPQSLPASELRCYFYKDDKILMSTSNTYNWPC